MFKQFLHHDWFVQCVGDRAQVPANIRDALVPAKVPGCVHTDLLRAGLIDDPYFGLNEPKLLWIGETDWQYRTTFDAHAKLFDHERIDLVCDGLDTVAKIELNGSLIAQTENMHRGYRFDVRKHLKKGRNELAITFASPVNYAKAMCDRLSFLPSINYGTPFNFIRKMACNFGWDWGPVVPTCGIWRRVALEAWSGGRISHVREQITLNRGSAIVDLAIQLDLTNTEEFSIYTELGFGPNLIVDGYAKFSKDRSTATLQLELDKLQLWWPKSHGAQPLYWLSTSLAEKISPTKHVNRLDERSHHIGLRTVELDTSPDDIGRKFVLKVNGKPIFCKGFNWIPDDCFLDRACEPARVRKRIQQALDANANMLRVWGGGIYETDEFYNICDEMGVLAWQDFLFACAAYPEAEPIKSEVEAEARYNVARLAHHPSLVLWNGCNENLWGFHEWSTDDVSGKKVPWKEQLAGKKWGPGYYLDLLPKIVAELDPSRPYWAASPWSGDPDVEHGLHPNLATHGNKHIWEVWHGPGDYENYRWFSPRFCSEFGYQGPANFATMAKYFPPEDLRRGSPSMQMHQKSPGGNERNDRLLQKNFELPENFDDWIYLLQLNQARALQTGVEWFRSRQPICMGTLYWQLNDCYPVTSWSAIDCDGRLKPLWYATRKFYAPRLLTIQPETDALLLYANNDTDEPWRGKIIVRRMNFSGKELAHIETTIDANPRENVRAVALPDSIVTADDKSGELIVAEIDGVRAFHFFMPDKELNYPLPDYRVSLESSHVTITTNTLLRDLVINIDRLDSDAVIDDNVITLLPGESHRFAIQSAKKFAQQDFQGPPIIQCANRFGKTP
jgi:beta-mannosidase